MDELYEKQEDGSLRPIVYPSHLVKKVDIYKWMGKQGLNLDEIKFLWDGVPRDRA